MPLATVKGFRKGLCLKILLKNNTAIKVEEVTKVVDLALERFTIRKIKPFRDSAS
jgi:trigger factor